MHRDQEPALCPGGLSVPRGRATLAARGSQARRDRPSHGGDRRRHGRPGGGGTQATLPSTKGAGTGGSDGTEIGASADVAVGKAASFTLTSANDEPGLVAQPSTGQFVAYSAICPHEGCTVGWSAQSPEIFSCPCHGSVFSVSNGAWISGPAPKGLTPFTVTDSKGKLYVKE